MEFTIRLAGVPIRITTLYGTTREFCTAYLCDEAPLMNIVSTRERIQAEQLRSEQEDREANRDTRYFNDAYLETLSVYRQIAEGLIDFNVLLFHGSALAVDGQGYLFAARSGTGKSTHARLWREVLPGLGHRVVMINDDKPLLRFTDHGILVCGTPWDGMYRLSSNRMTPLRALCALKRGERNEVRPVTGDEIWPVLLRQCYRPRTETHLKHTLELLRTLAGSGRFFELRCTMEPEAAAISYAGMC